MGDLRRFIRIFHPVAGRFVRYLAKWLTPTTEWIRNILGPIRQKSGSGFRLMEKSGFKSRITFSAWQSLRSLSSLVVHVCLKMWLKARKYTCCVDAARVVVHSKLVVQPQKSDEVQEKHQYEEQLEERRARDGAYGFNPLMLALKLHSNGLWWSVHWPLMGGLLHSVQY